jgi:hypothetical protein
MKQSNPTLAELVAELDTLEDELAIYAAPRWRPNSPAIALAEPEDGSVPAEAHGKTFFLTVKAAKQLLVARRATRPGASETPEDLASALVYCAIYDEAEPVPSLQGRDLILTVL